MCLFLQDAVEGADIAAALGGQLIGHRVYHCLGKTSGTLVDQFALIGEVLIQHVTAEG